jgi:hypothetical protein
MSDDAAIARAEWRAEEEQWSRAAFERWEHGRGLVDVVRDCMHRGDTVTFGFPSQAWSGDVVAVGRDVACVDTGAARVAIRLRADAPFVLRVRSSNVGTRDRNAAAGRDDGPLTTFTARLREVDGTALCIGTSAGPLEGRLRIGVDQLRLTHVAGGVAYVPIDSVWWLRPLDD